MLPLYNKAIVKDLKALCKLKGLKVSRKKLHLCLFLSSYKALQYIYMHEKLGQREWSPRDKRIITTEVVAAAAKEL